MHKVPKEVARTDEAYYSNLSHVLATLKERNPSHQGISKWEKVSVGPFFFHHGQSPNFITKSNEITEFQGSE